MISKVLFVMGIFPVVAVFVGLFLYFFNKEAGMPVTEAVKRDRIAAITPTVLFFIASAALLFLGALATHTLGW